MKNFVVHWTNAEGTRETMAVESQDRADRVCRLLRLAGVADVWVSCDLAEME